MSRIRDADLLLLSSYHQAQGRLQAILNLWTVAEAAGVPRERAEDAYTYLLRRAYIVSRGIGGYYSLAASAVDAVEVQATPAERDERSASRWSFLKLSYELTEGSTGALLSMWDVGQRLGWDKPQTSEAYEYLQAKGLVRAKALGGLFSITEEAVDLVERASADPDSATAYFPPLSSLHVHIRDSFNDSNIVNAIIASPGARLTAGPVTVGSDATNGQVSRALETLREEVSRAQLSREAKADALSHIEAMHEQLRKPTWSPAVLRSLFFSFQDIAGRAIAAAAGARAALEVIRLFLGR